MYRDIWDQLFREGIVKKVSKEYNLEYLVEICEIDRERWIFAHTITYPDECPSEPSHRYFVEPLGEIAMLQMEDPDLSLVSLPEVQEQKWRDMLGQATALPTCPHCRRIWD